MRETRKLGPVTAYAIACEHGFVGTEEEWLASLHPSSEEMQGYLTEYFDLNPAQRVADHSVTAQKLGSDVAATLSGLTTKDAELTAGLGVLQTQIDQLIKPDATIEGASAAEVENARIGVDGTEYETLGAAIRGQVTALQDEIDRQEEVELIEDGGVDYDYGTPAHLAEHPEATNATVYGVDRTGMIVKVTNSTALINREAAVRLTGPVVRLVLGTTGANDTIDAWTTGVRLEAGHTYQIRKYLVSGLEDGATSVSVYKQGEHLTEGSGNTTRIGNLYTRTFVAEDAVYNIILYITRGTILTDANYIIKLIDLSKNAEAVPAVARLFDESVDYRDGDYVWANNAVHRFAQPHPAGEWTGEDAREIIMGDDLRVVMRQANLSYGAAQPPIPLSSIVEGQGINTSGARSLNRADRVRTNRIANLPEGMVLRVGDTPLWAVGYKDEPRGDGEAYDNYLTRTFNGTLSGRLINTEIFLDPEHYPVIILVGQCETAEQMQAAISLYASTAAVDHPQVADYYLPELEDTVAKVRDMCDEPSLVFTWATDIHRWSDNAGGVQSFEAMIQNMSEFAKRVKSDFVLFTGDLTDGNVAKATTIDRAHDCLEKFRTIGVPFVWAQGNHDNNPYKGDANLFTMPECFKAYFTSTRARMNLAENGTDYYVDFDELGIRLIVLNANNCTERSKYAYGSTTVSWLNSVLDPDKKVLLAIHQTPYTTHTYADATETYRAASMKAAINTFIENGGDIVVISGHSHLDMAFIDPWVEVMQDCQRFCPDVTEDMIDPEVSPSGAYIDVVRKNARAAGTASEDLWTACVYQPFSNNLFLVRFGAGVDRYLHCDPLQTARSVTTRLTGTVDWSTSDPDVATVSDGEISITGSGKCAVIAKNEAGDIEVWIVQTA